MKRIKFTDDVIREGVRRACTMFDGSDDRWNVLHATGATNDEIRKQIAEEFYLGGADNIFRHDGGSHPKVYSWNGKVCISGKALIVMVREIFAIPRKRVGCPVQLPLLQLEALNVSTQKSECP